MAQNKAGSRKLKGDFAGVVLKKSESGGLMIDLSALENVDVTIIGGNAVRWFKQQTLEQNNAVSSTVTKKSYIVGDVLESGPQKGWLIVNFNSSGYVKLLEPAASASQDVVTWGKGKEHEAALRAQGHLTARLWTQEDVGDIIENIVKGGHNSKADLDLKEYAPAGRYWGDSGGQDNPANAIAYYPGNSNRYLLSKGSVARVRCVQDVAQLTL